MTTKVFTNGCFDLLHRGHIELLKYAKSLGDVLIVAIDTDQRVKELKGADRPIYSVNDRIEILKSIRYVDEVCVFDNEYGLEQLIKFYKPKILVKGSDWETGQIVGSHLVKEVVFFKRLHEYSTTKTIQRITDR